MRQVNRPALPSYCLSAANGQICDAFYNVFVPNSCSFLYTNTNAYVQLVVTGPEKKHKGPFVSALKSPSSLTSMMCLTAIDDGENMRLNKPLKVPIFYIVSVKVAATVQLIMNAFIYFCDVSALRQKLDMTYRIGKNSRTYSTISQLLHSRFPNHTTMVSQLPLSGLMFFKTWHQL